MFAMYVFNRLIGAVGFLKNVYLRQIIAYFQTNHNIILNDNNIRFSKQHVKIILDVEANIDFKNTEKQLKDIYPFAPIILIATHKRSEASMEPPPKIGRHGGKKKIDRQHIKTIIAVASGKGGVGKSTISLNLARAFHKMGHKTALIDADIYGPSIPLMTGGYKPAHYENNKLIPVMRDGMQTMSIGYMIDPSKPMIWRGPMISGAIEQMFNDVAWDQTDIMVIDMPPGTGDAQLTLCQNIAPEASVIVSTPQIISVIDAERCATMFKELGVPIAGVIENMSGFVAPDTGKTYHIFGKDGAKDFAEKNNYPFLGALPLYSELPYLSDQGSNLYTMKNSAHLTEQFENFAKKILNTL